MNWGALYIYEKYRERECKIMEMLGYKYDSLNMWWQKGFLLARFIYEVNGSKCVPFFFMSDENNLNWKRYQLTQ